ncbi:hypothetical protein K3758_01160 [Sulfitobacter sp. W002]|uniref:hypothetical protein n=1 Tax=Sulfitobacter sp. W002 TaxID=2867024 RepID=UPI0021A66C50|nr:hypothetical protein [Sulfitobacter sp. W002]UWR30184.1 hypothetical protein K3758_01160 [Sulfitobacter sp. W002]
MTCAVTFHGGTSIVPSYDGVNRFFGGLTQVATNVAGLSAASLRSPTEERLRQIQGKISDISMHLPRGFAAGLNRQFANLMDEDAWEDEDELISLKALNAFLIVLLCTRTRRRPGIGTNGEGSITAAWTVDRNRLTIECLSSGRTSIVLSREGRSGEIERAAFGSVRPHRIPSLLAPFAQEVWFDG